MYPKVGKKHNFDHLAAKLCPILYPSHMACLVLQMIVTAYVIQIFGSGSGEILNLSIIGFTNECRAE